MAEVGINENQLHVIAKNDAAPTRMSDSNKDEGNILKKFRLFGWSNGFHVPFANASNQHLEEILDAKQRKILALQAELQDHVDHVQTISNNFNRVSDDLIVHQALLTHKKAEVQGNENLVNIAERIHGKVIGEKAAFLSEIDDLNKRNIFQTKKLSKREEAIKELVNIVITDKEKALVFQKRTEASEAEIDAVGEYKVADDRQLSEHEAKQVDLGAKRKLLRYRLDHEAMDTAKCQEQLNRASTEYRKVHEQRQEMITMWTKTLHAMRSKDQLMKEMADEYFDLRDSLRELKAMVDSKERQLEEQRCTVGGTDGQMAEIERRIVKLREEFKEMNECVVNNYTMYRNGHAVLQSMEYETNMALRKLNELQDNLSNASNNTKRSEDVVIALRAKCKNVMSTTKSAEECTIEAEKMLEAEEEGLNFYTTRLKTVQQYFWERSNEKRGIEVEILSVETRLHRMKNSSGFLHGKIMTNIEYSAKKSSKIYKLDLEASNLEMRISKIEYNTITPTYFMWQDKIGGLRTLEAKLKEEQKFINRELEVLKEQAGKTRRDIQMYVEERKSLKENLFEVDLMTRKDSRVLEKKIKEYYDVQVRQSLMQLQLKRLERARQNTRETLGGLSEHRALVETVVKERTIEIEMHKALTESKLKSLRGGITKLNVQIGEMSGLTYRLKGRFHLTYKIMMGPQNADPKEHSFSYQIRKATRDRELLNMEVLKWQDAVEVARKELEGMNNVLMIMNSSNDNFRKSISPADDNSHEHVYTMKLEEEERQALVDNKRAKNIKAKLAEEINDLQQQIKVIQQDLFASRAICETKIHIASTSSAEAFRQTDKIKRWNSLIIRVTREVKTYMTEEQCANLQDELRLKFTTEKFECAVTMLDRLLGAFPGLRPEVLLRLEGIQSMEDIYYRIHHHRLPKARSLISGRFRKNRDGKGVSFTDSVRGKHSTKHITPHSKSAVVKPSIIDLLSGNRKQRTNSSRRSKATRTVSRKTTSRKSTPADK